MRFVLLEWLEFKIIIVICRIHYCNSKPMLFEICGLKALFQYLNQIKVVSQIFYPSLVFFLSKIKNSSFSILFYLKLIKKTCKLFLFK